MDPVDVVGLARTLIDIESTTGQEGPVARVLAEYLRGRGYSVLEQPVAGDRINVVAAVGEPALVFSTHFDCVPPFFPSRLEGGRLFGRGACDAKGILAAQVGAVERLRARGRHHDQRRGAVVHGRRVAGGDTAVLLEGGLQLAERFGRRVGAHRFVGAEHDRVALLLRNRHGQNFSGELAGGLRGGGR